MSPTARLPLLPPTSRDRITTHTQASSRCRPRDRSAPLPTQPLDHARGHHNQRPTRLPEPDSHRQATLNLSHLRHADLLSLMAPEQTRRTTTNRKRRWRQCGTLDRRSAQMPNRSSASGVVSLARDLESQLRSGSIWCDPATGSFSTISYVSRSNTNRVGDPVKSSESNANTHSGLSANTRLEVGSTMSIP